MVKFITSPSHGGHSYTQASLFGEQLVVYEVKEKKKRQSRNGSLSYEVNNQDIYKDVIVGEEGMPILNPYDAPTPSNIVLFHERNSMFSSDSTCGFYTEDWRFMQIAKNPLDYVSDMKRFQSVIGPDFSQLVGMTDEMRRKNCYLNKAISQLWQVRGVNMIPNITWSTPDSYPYSVAGAPKHSVIAINSMGVKKYAVSVYLWRRGYEFMLETLEPSLIVRYGDKMPGECEDISVYFPNKHLLRMRGGAYGG